MVGLTELWLPIILSAVIVFVASAIIHMALRYHWKDNAPLPGEGAVREVMRKQGIGPGDYIVPHAGSPAAMRDPELIKKFEEGPVGFLTLLPSGPPAMGRNLFQWFVYAVAISFMVAYITGRTVATGAEYLHVFRVAATVAFLAYAGAEPIASIWRGRKWSTTLKNMLDGLIYAWLTGGVFGWLWPS
jgi:hypothetical protein